MNQLIKIALILLAGATVRRMVRRKQNTVVRVQPITKVDLEKIGGTITTLFP